jgi:lactate racemase
MSHPCLVTLDKGSKPRVLFAGDRLAQVPLPPGARVVYPRPAARPVRELTAAIREALDQPLGTAPLHAQLRPGMKVTLAVDDFSVAPPAIGSVDARQSLLEALLAELSNYAVSDVEIVIATGVRRRLKAREIQRLVGERVYAAFWPKRLYNLDPECPTQMCELGQTQQGDVLELQRRAVQSDLLIHVSLSSGELAGSKQTLLTGLSGYRTTRAFCNPETDQAVAAERAASMQRLADEHLKVFVVSATLSDPGFADAFGFLARNEDELPHHERQLLSALVGASRKLPQFAWQALLARMPAACAVSAVTAGDPALVHARTQQRIQEQLRVPLEGQADVLVTGIGNAGPYNVDAFLNPLLVSAMAESRVFGALRAAPLVKLGGTLIITHPCTDKFDHEQHTPYIDFVHQLLPQTRDAAELHDRYEAKFAANPAFLEMFRKGHAYHPAHPFFVWYAGQAARRHLGKVIVVGADNEYVPKLLGYETAPNIAEALYRAGSGAEQSIVCVHTPPLVLGDLRSPSASAGGSLRSAVLGEASS